MQLIAREFECYPMGGSAHRLLFPLVNRLGELPFTGSVGQKNSGQWDSDLDDRLADRFCKMSGVARLEIPMPTIKKTFDFAFCRKEQKVVVEVEKANWEKVLYDFLKAHMYFAAGADFAMVFVPKNYVHSGKSPKKSFQQARQRYDHCVEYGFGTPESLGKILLVGYEVALGDGRTLTPTLRKHYITEAREASMISRP